MISTSSSIKNGETYTLDNKVYTKGENVFASIGDALKGVANSGTIILKDSVYNGSFVITKPVVIEGSGFVTVNGTFECRAKDVVFKNLTVTYNRSAAGESAIVLGDGIRESDISTKNCNFVDAKKGTTGVKIKSQTNVPAASSGGGGGGGALRENALPSKTENIAKKLFDEKTFNKDGAIKPEVKNGKTNTEN